MNKIITSSNYEVIPLDARTNVRFYTSIDPGSYVPPHWHDAIEVVYLQEGELKINIEGTSRKLLPGQCVLIQPNTIHSTLCTHPNQAIVFQIPMTFMEKFVPDFASLTFQLDDPPKLDALPAALNLTAAPNLATTPNLATLSDTADEKRQWTKLQQFKKSLEKMQFIMDTEPDGALLLFNGVLFDTLYQLYHNFSKVQAETVSADTRQSRNLEKLKPVLNYINDNYNHPISLEEISQVAMFDSKYFCRFFKKCMGTTFLEYQNQIRISHIYQDLISTDDKVGEILERHGFTNYKLFRRVFYEHFGCTPTEVRKGITPAPANK